MPVMTVIVVDCFPLILENRTHIGDILEGDAFSKNDEFNVRKISFWVSSVFKIKFTHWDESIVNSFYIYRDYITANILHKNCCHCRYVGIDKKNQGILDIFIRKNVLLLLLFNDRLLNIRNRFKQYICCWRLNLCS